MCIFKYFFKIADNDDSWIASQILKDESWK